MNFTRKRLYLVSFFLLVVNQSLAESATSVKTEQVRMAPLQERLPLVGTVISPKISALSMKESGYVQHRHVYAGDRVSEGQSLLVLDKKMGQMELERLSLAVEEAAHRYAEAKRLESEAARLIQKSHISHTELEARKVRTATSSVRWKQLKVQYAIQKEKVSRHELTAPFSGVIAEMLTEQGQWLANNQSALTLMQMNPLEVDVSVPERYYGQIHEKDEVTLTLGAQAWPIKAAVTRINPINDETSRSYRVRIAVANADWRYSPGMMAKAEFLLEGDESLVKLIPNDALLRNIHGETRVWVARNQNGQPRATPIDVSVKRSMGAWTEVVSDQLKASDVVVVIGNENLQPNQLLTLEAASKQAYQATKAINPTSHELGVASDA